MIQERPSPASLHTAEKIHGPVKRCETLKEVLADKESAFKKCLAGTNPLDRIRMVAPDTVGIDYLALEGFPLRLEAFPPRCPCETMVAGCNCPHSRNGIWNDAGDQDPDNQIDPGPIESVEEIMLYSPPVGLHDHGRLQDRDLCCVRGPSPQLPLARTVPIDEQVRPKPKKPRPLHHQYTSEAQS